MNITKTLLVVLGLGVLFGLAYNSKPFINTNRDKCQNLDAKNVILESQNIEAKKNQYASSSKVIIGQSSEGGHQISYRLGGRLTLVEQIFYGETGKSEVVYYLDGDRVFYLVKKNFEYAKPLTEDPTGTVVKIDTKQFYLDDSQHLCKWSLNGSTQTNDKDTRDLVDYLISTLAT